MKEDLEIIKRVLSGEKEAFSEIFLRHYDFIFKSVMKYISIEDKAKDITQDVFIKAYEKLETFKNDSKLSSWLYSIAYNLSMNYITREKDRFVELNDSDFFASNETQDDIYDKEMIKELADALEELPAHYRIIIKLYYFDEKSYEEISEILNIPINTVKTQLFRAKDKIKKYFEDE
ncbi:MAG: RNA polymerase sigma factor [Elusimicrobiales bacterium]|nr:RNA polymerase sigma factor [Elusimicrobiales bacterium]